MPSAFVRLQGCSVGCTWCDTKYSWASTGGREMTLDAVRETRAAHRLASSRILLMPLGMRREEQQARMSAVIEWCRRHGFRFSPRLHILIWGPKRLGCAATRRHAVLVARRVAVIVP